MSTLAGRPNTALLVVDVQNGVVAEAYNRSNVIANIATMVEKARAAHVDVLWIQHNSEDLAPDSESWQYVRELVRRDGEPLVQKAYGDSFEETELESVLAARGVGRLVVTGRRPMHASARPCTARSPGATTRRWSATPTRRRTFRRTAHRRPRPSSPTPTCTGVTTRRPAGARARSTRPTSTSPRRSLLAEARLPP